MTRVVVIEQTCSPRGSSYRRAVEQDADTGTVLHVIATERTSNRVDAQAASYARINGIPCRMGVAA